MKYTLKPLAMLVILLAAILTASAQEFRTDESIKSQLMKGTAPGLKFAPATSTVKRTAAHDKQEGRESTISQIRKKTYKGMPFAQGGGPANGTARRSARTQQGNVKLSSDVKPEKQAPVNKTPAITIPDQNQPGNR